MKRIDFIKGSCSVCIALSSGFVMNAILSSCKTSLSVLKTSAHDNVVSIPLTEFAQSSYKLVRVNNYSFDLAVQKLADGSFETLVLVCTHASQPLTRTGNTYFCTAHGSQFAHDGHVVKGPAEKSLAKLHTTVNNEFLTIKLT